MTSPIFHRAVADVILLTIDPQCLDGEIKIENLFPHIYGPLPLAAVIRTAFVRLDAGGTLDLEAATSNEARQSC